MRTKKKTGTSVFPVLQAICRRGMGNVSCGAERSRPHRVYHHIAFKISQTLQLPSNDFLVESTWFFYSDDVFCVYFSPGHYRYIEPLCHG